MGTALFTPKSCLRFNIQEPTERTIYFIDNAESCKGFKSGYE